MFAAFAFVSQFRLFFGASTTEELSGWSRMDEAAQALRGGARECGLVFSTVSVTPDLLLLECPFGDFNWWRASGFLCRPTGQEKEFLKQNHAPDLDWAIKLFQWRIAWLSREEERLKEDFLRHRNDLLRAASKQRDDGLRHLQDLIGEELRQINQIQAAMETAPARLAPALPSSPAPARTWEPLAPESLARQLQSRRMRLSRLLAGIPRREASLMARHASSAALAEQNCRLRLASLWKYQTARRLLWEKVLHYERQRQAFFSLVSLHSDKFLGSEELRNGRIPLLAG